MLQKITVRVDRQVMDEGNDIQSFVDTVRRGVTKNFALFEGNEKWDVWPVEIHLDRVIVENSAKGEFLMADMSINEDGAPVFSNIREVHRQWVIAEPAERATDGNESTKEVYQPGPCENLTVEREAPSSSREKTPFAGVLGVVVLRVHEGRNRANDGPQLQRV